MAYEAAMAGAESSGKRRSRSNKSTAAAHANKDLFPMKLYEMLESVAGLGLAHTVSWLHHGRSFQVIDIIQFMNLVVPRFFKATMYRSFQRQLNLWGFTRIVKGEAYPTWQHEFFIRGHPELISKITRTRIKENHATGNPNETQNFNHRMPAPSEDNSEGASDYNDEGGGNEDGSCSSDNTKQISNLHGYVVPPFKDNVFDEKVNSIFSERSPNQSSGYASMDLEPLPIDSAGILDESGNRNDIELAEFGQLLGRL